MVAADQIIMVATAETTIVATVLAECSDDTVAIAPIMTPASNSNPAEGDDGDVGGT